MLTSETFLEEKSNCTINRLQFPNALIDKNHSRLTTNLTLLRRFYLKEWEVLKENCEKRFINHIFCNYN